MRATAEHCVSDSRIFLRTKEQKIDRVRIALEKIGCGADMIKESPLGKIANAGVIATMRFIPGAVLFGTALQFLAHFLATKALNKPCSAAMADAPP